MEYKDESNPNSQNNIEDEDEQDIIDFEVEEFYREIIPQFEDPEIPKNLINMIISKLIDLINSDVEVDLAVIDKMLQYFINTGNLSYEISAFMKLWLSKQDHLEIFTSSGLVETFINVFHRIAGWFQTLVLKDKKLQTVLLENNFILKTAVMFLDPENFSQNVFVQNTKLINSLIILTDGYSQEVCNELINVYIQYIKVSVPRTIEYITKIKSDLENKFEEEMKNAQGSARDELYELFQSYRDKHPQITMFAVSFELLNSIFSFHEENFPRLPEILEDIHPLLDLQVDYNFDQHLAYLLASACEKTRFDVPKEIIDVFCKHLPQTTETGANNFPQAFAHLFTEICKMENDEAVDAIMKTDVLSFMLKKIDSGSSSEKNQCFSFFIPLLSPRYFASSREMLENGLMLTLCDLSTVVRQISRWDFYANLMEIFEIFIREGSFMLENPIIQQILDSEMFDFLDDIDEQTELEKALFDKLCELNDMREMDA